MLVEKILAMVSDHQYRPMTVDEMAQVLGFDKQEKKAKTEPSRSVRNKQADRLQSHLKIKFKDKNL